MMPDAKNNRLNINNAIRCDILNKGENALSEKIITLNNNRTAALWLHIIDIVRKFICAARLGDWLLHLFTLQEMLPILPHADKITTPSQLDYTYIKCQHLMKSIIHISSKIL